jgi:hypothetical protein
MKTALDVNASGIKRRSSNTGCQVDHAGNPYEAAKKYESSDNDSIQVKNNQLLMEEEQ